MDRTHTEGVTRRQFFNRSALSMLGLGAASFGSATLAFLWPRRASGSFGSSVDAGRIDAITETLDATRQPVFVPAGRFYLVRYPEEALERGLAVYDEALVPGMTAGLVALYQRCPHLGCRVPFCPTAQWFECPCHSSQFNRVGERRAGPAPRGMDRFPVRVVDGAVLVDTNVEITGPPAGTDTTGQQAEGPHCVRPVGAEARGAG